jgi:prepilin-type processing-associated H-X9-DG protein
MKDDSHTSAFTLADLLAVLGAVSLLCCLVLPALGDNRATARTLQCLNNLRQLGKGWLLYADDHQGRLVPNRDGASGHSPGTASWVGGWLDYYSNSDNTNTSYLVGPAPYCGLLGPYVRSAVYFKCPSDPSVVYLGGRWLPRVRSYSMNNYVGEGTSEFYPGYQTYWKLQNIVRPTPSQLWVIQEEHPDSINDGTFFTAPDHYFYDLPAAYHNASGNFLWADGHADSHRWLNERTLAPIRRTEINVIGPNDSDGTWLQSHASELR